MLLDIEASVGSSHVRERDKYGLNVDPINVLIDDLIHMSEDDNKRIYRPWSYSVIIKVLGKIIEPPVSQKKFSILWKATEEIILIDLDHKYYVVKFVKEENS